MRSMEVVSPMTAAQVRLEGATAIDTKGVDVNKGDAVDDERMEIRSRLVAKELRRKQERQGITRDDVFSATPPHEAIKYLLSASAE